MKSIAKAVLVGGFIIASQAALADGPASPRGAMDTGLNVPVQSTYTERHANDPVKSAGPALPRGTMDTGLNVPVQSTYMERHGNDPVKSGGSAFPAETEE